MRKYLLKTCVILFSCFGLILHADAVGVSAVHNNPGDNGSYRFKGCTGCGSLTSYGTYNYIDLQNGQTAYCIDPGYGAIKGTGVTCEPVAGISPNLKKSLIYIFSQKADPITTSMAIKQVSYLHGDSSNFTTGDSNCAYIALLTESFKTAKIDDLVDFGGDECERVKVSTTGSNSAKAKKAIELAGYAEKYTEDWWEEKTTTEKHTITITNESTDTKKGTITFTIKNPDKVEYELDIKCDANIDTTKSKYCNKIEKHKDSSLKLTFYKNSSGDDTTCGNVTGTIKYVSEVTKGKGEDPLGNEQCTDVTVYKCTTGSKKVQRYASCSNWKTITSSKDDDGDGSKKEATININKTVCKEKTTTPTPPVIKKGPCTKTATQTRIVDEAAASLCTGIAGTVLYVNEATELTKEKTDVDNCVLEDDYLYKTIDTDLCKMYCVEDYQFFSEGLALDESDYKKIDDKYAFAVTAGSYFSFATPNATNMSTIKCYTQIDYYKFWELVGKAIEDFENSTKTETARCEPYGDVEPYVTDEGEIDYRPVTHYKVMTKTTEYDASIDENSYSISISKTTSSESTDRYYQKDSVSCYADAAKINLDNKNKLENGLKTLKRDINDIIERVKKCVDKGKQGFSSSDATSCNDEIKATMTYQFNNTEGKIIESFVPESLTSDDTIKPKYSANCDSNLFSRCTYSEQNTEPSQKSISISVPSEGKLEKTSDFRPTAFVNKSINIKSTYQLNGKEYCNDYNTGTITRKTGDCGNATTFAGYPVPYNTEAGIYYYGIKVVGYGYLKDSSNKCSRLYNKYNRKSDGMDAVCPLVVNGKDPCKDDPSKCKESHKCEIIGDKDGSLHYYDINGNEVAIGGYVASCKVRCRVLEGIYYDLNGKQVDYKDYIKVCPDPGGGSGPDPNPPCKYPNCPWTCDPITNKCNPETCNGNCPWQCIGVGCIYNESNGLLMNYQPISLLNIDESLVYLYDKYDGITALANNANNIRVQQLSYSDGKISSHNWGSTKGLSTLKSMIDDKKGEQIYVDNLEYQFVLTPERTKAIQDYNQTQLNTSDGGYLNHTLTCTKNAGDYVTCTSSYLDELERNGTLTIRRNDFVPYSSPEEKKSGIGPAWK